MNSPRRTAWTAANEDKKRLSEALREKAKAQNRVREMERRQDGSYVTVAETVRPLRLSSRELLRLGRQMAAQVNRMGVTDGNGRKKEKTL